MPGDALVLSEVFGPTIQGEGRHAGTPAIFVRLGLCNLDCQWCDTPYTWDWTRYDRHHELARIRTSTVVATAESMIEREDTIIVVSGGEPLMQHKAVTEFAFLVSVPVHIETNGTRDPAIGIAWYSVSPKLLPSAGVDRDRAYVPAALRALAEEPGAIKLVVDPSVDTATDIDLACVQLRLNGWDHDRIDLMPEGATPDRVDRNFGPVLDLAHDLGLGISPRLHVTLLGGGRGV